MHRTLSVLATAASIAAAVRLGANLAPTEGSIDATCAFPANYTVENFVSWTPSATNNGTASPFVKFGYIDEDTNVTTSCQWNSTSKVVSSAGLTPRYGCDDPLVQFIWENATNLLDLIERVCPNSNGKSSIEVSGQINLDLQCNATNCESATGDGLECLTLTPNLVVNFTALDPIPPTPSGT